MRKKSSRPALLDEWGLYATGSGQRKYPTAEERQTFIAAADAAAARGTNLCLTLVHLGCRLSEALALTAGGQLVVKGVLATARVYRLPASPKGLRHAYGAHAVLSGVPLHLVQRWLFHVDILWVPLMV